MNNNWTLKIEFESDWHVGEGAGQPGHIDRIIRRDPVDGLPYVPAKTITGIWRDGCERVAWGLDRPKCGNWSAWVDTLFGDQPREGEPVATGPRPALLSVRAAYFSDALRQVLKEKPLLAQALTFVKPGIQIERDSGRAKDKHLRFEERVRGGVTLTASVSLDGLEEDQVCTAKALLWAGAQAVERLGGKRRRGSGRCRFRFNEIDKNKALRLLEKDAPKLPDRNSSSPQWDFSAGSVAVDQDWQCLPLILTLKSPVVIPRATVGNVVESLDFVPGGQLLGAISHRLKPLCGDLFAYIARGDLIVSNAYLKVAGERGLPTPLCLFHDKEKGGIDKGEQVYNRLIEQVQDSGSQLKQHRAGYLAWQKESSPGFGKIELQHTTHGTIDDASQRPTSDVGGVFTFQAIPAGTHLRAELRLRTTLAKRLEEKKKDWWKDLSGDVRLGKAKKDDYGHADLYVGDKLEQWQPASDSSTKGYLTAWLLSDLLLFSTETLQPVVTVAGLAEVLSERLGIKLEPCSQGDANVYSRTRRSDGWHQGWGLPRPSYIGLAAGSCFSFKIEGELGEEKLKELAAAGLGERRAEGYGEVAFNHPIVSQPLPANEQESAPTNGKEKDKSPLTDKQESTSIERQEKDKKHLVLNEVEQKLVQNLTRSIWYNDICRLADILAVDESRRERFGWEKQKPTNSQFGAWRQILRRLKNEPKQIEDACGWLKKAIEADKWPEKAVNLLSNKDDVWKWLENEASGQPLFLSVEGADLKQELWLEAVRTVYVAAIRAEQREREKKSEDKSNGQIDH